MKNIIAWCVLLVLIIGVAIYGKIKLDDAKKESDSIVNRINELAGKNDSLKTELAKAAQELLGKIGNLEKENSELKKDMAEAKETLKGINEQLLALKNENDGLKKELVQVKEELTKLLPKTGKKDADFAEFLGITKEKLATLTTEEMTDIMKKALQEIPLEKLYKSIEEFTGITKDEISPDVEIGDYCTRLCEINEAYEMPGEGEKVAFGTAISDDNTPKKPSETFNGAVDKRIYASFANQGKLEGLSKVIVRWMRISDKTISYVGTKPIDASNDNNYIYVEKRKGWPKGIYRVELFRIDTAEKVAQGTFEIKAEETEPDDSELYFPESEDAPDSGNE